MAYPTKRSVAYYMVYPSFSLRAPGNGPLIDQADAFALIRFIAKLTPLPMAREFLTGRKVLLVEDHDDLLSLLTAFLFRYGALVTACASISAAIDSVTRAYPDLVITDIRLLDGDGFQLLSVIKKLDLESGTDTPVLAMSAHADLILGRRAADAGFSGFLRKPFTPDKLIDAISEVLGPDQEAP